MVTRAPAKTFETVVIGEVLGPHAIVITREQARNYALACGMSTPRFMSDEDARREEGLPAMLTPGNMTLGIMAKLVTDWLGSGSGQLARIGTTFRSFVHPGVELTLHGFVTHTDAAARSADLDVWMEDEDGERLVVGTATVAFGPAE